MQVAVKPDRPCGPQRAIALLAEAIICRRAPRTLGHQITATFLRLASLPPTEVRVTAAARLSSTKIGKWPGPRRRSNRQRRQCLNVGDNIDDDRTLRLNRSDDRVAELVWFFDADAECANLLGHAGKINGVEGP
jgi:hypothetical protein